MSDRIQRLAAAWLARWMARAFGSRCTTYDLDDFPEEPYQPRDGLHSRCAQCWAWDLVDNLREFAR